MVLPSIFSDTAICFVHVSVVKIASLNAPGVAKLASLICSVPVLILSIGKYSPITPVEATATCSDGI
ncbi:Uncharacterised protein [Staphylococcus aureus]|nr:Uncharacterised protein [Staphylococcus aureus]